MAQLGLDAILVTHVPSICYLTGYETPLATWYHCLVVAIDGRMNAHLVDVEMPTMKATGLSDNAVYSASESPLDAARELATILETLDLTAGVVGTESDLPGCSAAWYSALSDLVPKVKFENVSSLITDVRAVKSEAEILHIRQAASFTDIGMQAGLRSIIQGATDNDVCAAALYAMIRAGSEYASIPPLFYFDEDEHLSHLSFRRRVIDVSDVVTLEIAGIFHRYAAPMYRTATLRKPGREIRMFAEASAALLDIVLDRIRPGRPAAEVAEDIRERSIDITRNFINPRTSYGYSVGLGLPPDWVEHSMLLNEKTGRRLEPGMVFHTPTSLRTPGHRGVTFSETVLVTDSGCEALTKSPRELFLA